MKTKIFSVKQEFSVKEELTVMQLESLNDSLEKHSAELKKWQGQSQELSEKLKMRRTKRLLHIIRNELAEKSDLLKIEEMLQPPFDRCFLKIPSPTPIIAPVPIGVPLSLIPTINSCKCLSSFSPRSNGSPRFLLGSLSMIFYSPGLAAFAVNKPLTSTHLTNL